MANLSMCQYEECSKRKYCYRQTAKITTQSHSLFQNICRLDNNYHWFYYDYKDIPEEEIDEFVEGLREEAVNKIKNHNKKEIVKNEETI